MPHISFMRCACIRLWCARPLGADVMLKLLSCPHVFRCAGRGHYRLVQAIVEAAVIAHGPARAKQRCINHTNHKGHSALTLACMNG
jgi:hypothetical protein